MFTHIINYILIIFYKHKSTLVRTHHVSKTLKIEMLISIFVFFYTFLYHRRLIMKRLNYNENKYAHNKCTLTYVYFVCSATQEVPEVCCKCSRLYKEYL